MVFYFDNRIYRWIASHFFKAESFKHFEYCFQIFPAGKPDYFSAKGWTAKAPVKEREEENIIYISEKL